MADDDFVAECIRKVGFEVTPEEAGKLRLGLRLFGVKGRLSKEDWEAAAVAKGAAPYANGKERPSYAIGGTVAPGFELVKETFEGNFRKGLERDAQLCVYRRGVRVVDLWGSSTEPGVSSAPPTGYDGDTLQQVWSSTKMMEATAFAVANDRGWLKYSDRVAKHWPEYAQGGKAEQTVSDVLRHDAGLEFVPDQFTCEDIEAQADPNGKVSRLFAEQPAWTWRDGPDQGKTPRMYHAELRGLILNQILMRADPKRRTVGQLLAEEIAGPLGASFHCGTWPTRWDLRPRALLRSPSLPWTLANQIVPALAGGLIAQRPQNAAARPARAAVEAAAKEEKKRPKKEFHPSAFTSHPGKVERAPGQGAIAYNPEDWYENGRLIKAKGSHDPFLAAQAPRQTNLDVPSCSGRASARGMARIMAMWANRGELDGVRIISPAGVEAALSEVIRNQDRNNEKILAHPNWAGAVLDTAFSQGGIDCLHQNSTAVNHPRYLAAVQRLFGAEHWGWGGFGGSSLWFNRVDGMGFGYTVTGGNSGVMSGEAGDRLGPILGSLQKAIGALPQSKL